jgi:hypothetical protein
MFLHYKLKLLINFNSKINKNIVYGVKCSYHPKVEFCLSLFARSRQIHQIRTPQLCGPVILLSYSEAEYS